MKESGNTHEDALPAGTTSLRAEIGVAGIDLFAGATLVRHIPRANAPSKLSVGPGKRPLSSVKVW